MTIEIKGQIRGGKNHMMIDPRSGRHFPNRSWAKWRDDAIAQVLAAGKPLGYKSPTKATVRYRAGDLRRRDVPGIMDALWHVLERSGVVADDALLREVHWYTVLDRENPGATIDLTELGVVDG